MLITRDTPLAVIEEEYLFPFAGKLIIMPTVGIGTSRFPFPVAEKSTIVVASAHRTPGVATLFLVDAFLAFLAMCSAYALSPYFYVLAQAHRLPHFGHM